MAADSLDAELGGLLFKLKKIENAAGKKNEGPQSIIGEDGKEDKFLTLKQRILAHVDSAKTLLDTVQGLERTSSTNPKDLITEQSKLRQEMNVLMDEWKALETLYRAEAKKKRSKFSPEELAERSAALQEIFDQIQMIKDLQRSGYVKSRPAKGYEQVRMADMADAEAFRGGTSGGGRPGVHGSRNNYMTDQQRQKLELLDTKDKEIDKEIDDIEQGVDVLRDIALAAGEEVRIQSKIINTLDEKITNVHDQVVSVNAKLKDALEATRDSSKICVDIACILLLVGMIIVLYQLVIKK